MITRFEHAVAIAKQFGFLLEREDRVICGEFIRYSLNDNKGAEYECRTLSELSNAIAEAISNCAV